MAVGIVLAGAIIVFGLMFQPLLETVARRISDTTISHCTKDVGMREWKACPSDAFVRQRKVFVGK